MSARNRINKKVVRKPENGKRAGSLLKNAKHWGGELLKHEILTLVGKAIVWVFSNITYIIPFVTGGYALFLQFISDVGTSHPVALYIKDNPVLVSLTAVFIAVATPLFRVLFRLIARVVNKLIASMSVSEELQDEPSPAEQLVRAVGISAVKPHSKKSDKRRNWQDCVKNIASHHARDLRIMGATGWNTFGSGSSPLHKFLSKFDGEVKVLLMLPDPRLPALVRRAKETGRTPEIYVDEINRSVECIRALRSKGRNISLKFYTQTPIWKMLISNDFMWLQHYCKAQDVDETPVYEFFSDGDGGTSLFHPLYSVWLKRWERDDNKECHFVEPCSKSCETCGIQAAAPGIA